MQNPRGQTPRSRLVLFGFFGAVAIWLILEFAAFAILWVGGDSRRKGWRSFYRPHPYRAYELVPGRKADPPHCSTNNLGLRGRDLSPQKPPRTVRIVCMGGSTTYGDGAATDTHTYPALLEGFLRVHYKDRPFRIEVLNAGVDAYESLQVLIYFESKVLDWRPDIVLFQTGINDTLFIAACKRFASDYVHARKLFAPPPPLWWERSPFLTLLFARYTTAGNPYRPNDIRGMEPFIWKRGAIGRPTKEESEARLRSDRFRPYVRNLRNLIYVARGNGVIPVLLTLPYSPRETLLSRFVERADSLIRSVAADEGVILLDFAERMPWNPKSFYDACHLRDCHEGLERKARIVYDFIVKSGVVEKAAERAGLLRDAG